MALSHRIRFARKRWKQIVLFGLIWGLFMALHTYGTLMRQGWQDQTAIMYVVVLIFVGTLIGGMAGWAIALIFSARSIAPKRLAIALVIIPLATVGAAAFLFAMHYRIYYSQWHMPTFTLGWTVQFVFTTLSAFYLFAVQGLRMILPFGPIALFVAAGIFVKSTSDVDLIEK